MNQVLLEKIQDLILDLEAQNYVMRTELEMLDTVPFKGQTMDMAVTRKQEARGALHISELTVAALKDKIAKEVPEQL